jgi:hypothetical protein
VAPFAEQRLLHQRAERQRWRVQRRQRSPHGRRRPPRFPNQFLDRECARWNSTFAQPAAFKAKCEVEVTLVNDRGLLFYHLLRFLPLAA